MMSARGGDQGIAIAALTACDAAFGGALGQRFVHIRIIFIF
jgi:hypothetical protein